jgi:hypothetical protein
MGGFDQFKDKADEFADKAKSAAGERRDKAAESADDAPDMERGMQQEPGQRDRRSDVEDQARERMGSESNDAEQDDWA